MVKLSLVIASEQAHNAVVARIFREAGLEQGETSGLFRKDILPED